MFSGREVKYQRLLAASWLGSVWILAVSCQSADPQTSHYSDSTTSARGEPQLVLSAASKELFKNSSAFQQAIAADGVIGLAEYDGAALTMVSCMKERGFATAQEPVPDALHKYHLVFAYGPGQLEAGRSANQECFKEHFSEVTMAWADFVAPDGARILADAREAVLECYQLSLTARGAPPDTVEFDDVKKASLEGDSDAGGCFHQARIEYNLPFWGG